MGSYPALKSRIIAPPRNSPARRPRMLILPGSSALSPFRKEKLLHAHPAVTALGGQFVDFIDLLEPLTDDQQQVLAKLLQYGPAEVDEHVEGAALVVVPRLGSISPGPSKATHMWASVGL